MASKSKAVQAAEAADAAEAQARLRELFPVGSTVTTTLSHVSRSGMYRVINVLAVINGEVADVSHLVATATGNKWDTRHYGVGMGGVGMDLGFALVYGLARTLYRESGFPCIGQDQINMRNRCPSNDHANERGLDVDWTPGRLHSDAGYALSHRWA